MANRSRFLVALTDINKYFNQRAYKTYSYSDLKSILYENFQIWKLADYMTLEMFLDEMLKHTPLDKLDIKFGEEQSRRLYSYGAINIENLAVNIYPNSYLSHLSALNYYGSIYSTEENKLIYITKEQSKKYVDTLKKRNELNQANINSAFSKHPKISENSTIINDSTIVVLRGKYSNNLGVINKKEDGLKVTNPERTLIDIAVRPFYVGGVQRVLDAFKSLSENLNRVDIKLLADYLKKLDFIYPYHQAIGFYLDKCGGFRETDLIIFRQKLRVNDFYLDYNMKDVDYSPEWKIFFPKSLKY